MDTLPQVEIVTFEAVERWDYPRIKAWTYAYIGDTDIEAALRAPGLAAFELAHSWSILTDNHSTRRDNPIHPQIIAKLVSEFRQGAVARPVTVVAEADIREQCGYCVSDGHHRVRALQFLRVPTFAAVLQGEQAALQRLLDLCVTV